MNYKDLNEFFGYFNTSSYNKKQIGFHKPTMVMIYNFLSNLDIDDNKIKEIIEQIAYLEARRVDIPLFLELLTKSLGYESDYSLKEIVKVVLDIHDIYLKNINRVDLEDYIHEIEDSRIKMLFLKKNKKYIAKEFRTEEQLSYLENLKLVAAILLSDSEYKEFISSLNDFNKYQYSYSPVYNLKVYNRLRSKLKDINRLFFDILFGNEYVVSLVKNNICIKDIYKENVYTVSEEREKEPIQLDLFTYMDEVFEEEIIKPNVFQLCTIYNSQGMPEFKEEKDVMLYYQKVLTSSNKIELPRLKNTRSVSYTYEVN